MPTKSDLKKLPPKAAKAVEETIARAYYRHAAGTSISIMDIPKLYAEARAAIEKAAACTHGAAQHRRRLASQRGGAPQQRDARARGAETGDVLIQCATLGDIVYG